ncbi:MAG: hypothetical protein ACJ8F7_11340 [Gemmataceae bacterium]
MPEPLHPEVRYEPHDFSPRTVAVSLAATAALIIAALVGAGLLFRHYDRREQAEKESTLPLAALERERQAGLPVEERFRGQPPLEGLQERPYDPEAAPRRLREYGWVDRDKGVVHVPLERAEQEALANREKYLKSRPPK